MNEDKFKSVVMDGRKHMGLFGFGKKKDNNDKVNVNTTTTADEKLMIDRLCSHAGNVIAMLKNVLAGKNGIDLYIVMLYSAGLAGIACHEAVKATGGKQVVIECADGRKYFMGDNVNKYLHENKYSVTGFARAITQMPQEAVLGIVTRQANTLGSKDFVVAGNMNPEDFYKQVKSCWDGIMNNMTLKYCEKPEEWPILYGIVLQSVMAESIKLAAKEAVFNSAVDVVCAMSKMDQESLSSGN